MNLHLLKLPLLALAAVPQGPAAAEAPRVASEPRAAMPLATQPGLLNDGRDDFNFLFGSWRIQNRRLLKPLQGDAAWETFEATSSCHPILGGIGNQDEFRTPHRPGFIGMSLRFFDAVTGRWSIYWIDNRQGVLQPPVVGRFEGGRGVFEGPDDYGGRPILVRYTWSRVDTPTPRWEQAFSTDNGKTWETNWVMDFRRNAL